MYIVGSTALVQHIPMERTIKDVDAFVWPEELDDFYKDYDLVKEDGCKAVFTDGDIHIELEVGYPNTNQEAFLDLVGHPLGEVDIATVEELYILKMSHRFLKNSPHFHKTMRDIWIIRNSSGLSHSVYEVLEDMDYYHLAPHWKNWYEWRVENTYNYSHPRLNQGKKDFFNTDVFSDFEYTYDHDSIHKAIALDRGSPAYEKFTDGEVRVSREMFERLNYLTKLYSVYEESCVLALERAVIPNDMDPRRAFLIALEKCCTSIASGWWRDFAWENYHAVVNLYNTLEYKDLYYVNRFYQAKLMGILEPFVKES